MKNFIQVTKDLFRGSAPTHQEVVDLHHKYKIRKIISLDKKCGEKIDRITNLLNIEHLIIPIDGSHIQPLIELVSVDIGKLLGNGPTFVHCIHGKDRTGMVIAMYQCKEMGMSCQKAIAQAKKLGFGLGLHPQTIKTYEDIIKIYCQQDDHKNDTNSADIVSNEREPNSDWRGSVLDEADMKSTAPFMDPIQSYPYSVVYDYKYQQSPTRENYQQEQIDRKNLGDTYVPENEKTDAPLVGVYDNDAGIHGVGPVDIGGGFVNS